jgi:hypothetical protein
MVMRGCISKLVIDFSILCWSLGRGLSITLDALAVLGLLAPDCAGDSERLEKREVTAETAETAEPVDTVREPVVADAGVCVV